MRSLRGRLAALIGLLCLLTAGLPPLCRAADGPIGGGSPGSGGVATSGDSATSFFPSGELERTLLPVASGDCGANQWAKGVDADFILDCSQPAFSSIAAGTSTNALLVGSGGSLGATGTGTITATALATAGLRAAFDVIDVIDVDPAEPGSVSAGLQEALTQCNSGAGRCIVQLRADTTYTIPAESTWTADSYASCNSETNGDDDIWIRGHGPSSVVSFTDSVGTDVSRILCVSDGSKNIVISDFVINYTSTCSGSCTGEGSTALFIGGNVDDITVERMQVKATEAVTSGSSTSIYAIYTLHSNGTNPDTIPTRVKIKDSLIQTSTRGVQMIACDWCEVSGNIFTSAGIPNDSTSPPSVGLMAFYEGQGTKITGNALDMSRDGQTNVTYSSAIILHGDQSTTDAAGINRGALVSGNSITGLRTQDQSGVWVIGYSAANIVGNYFSAGICSASATRSCSIDEDCSDLGGTCDTAPAKGVAFDSTNSVIGTPRGLWNSVTTNFFDGFQDSGNNCPVSFFINGSQHADSLTKNNVAANTFRLNTTTDDGICGDAARILLNNIAGNYVVGGPVSVVRAGTATLGTSLIGSGACATVVTVAATGVLTSDVIQWTPNADISGVTGYAPVTTGALSIYPYPTADNINFKTCNPTASGITPGAVTLNWRVVR